MYYIYKKQQKCDGCGGNLVYSPNNQSLVCEKCFAVKQIKHMEHVALHSLKTALEVAKTKTKSQTGQRCMQCPNCGSKIMLKEFEVSGDCEYCGSSVVAQDVSLVVKKPDGIIPFMFDKEVAADRFTAGIKKQFWAPRKFKKKPPQSNIEGDYIPTFSFNAHAVYTYNGTLYKDEQVSDGDGGTKTVRKYFKISGAGNKQYNNLLVESSSKLTQQQINGVVPYNYAQSRKYDDAYIAGYVVEKYDNEVYNCLEKYNNLLVENIKHDILSQYQYDGVSELNITKSISDEKYSYYLVPVYKISYTYKNKPYQTYMNGQTGRIDSNVPKSGLKVFMCTGFPILLVMLFIALVFIFGR